MNPSVRMHTHIIELNSCSRVLRNHKHWVTYTSWKWIESSKVLRSCCGAFICSRLAQGLGVHTKTRSYISLKTLLIFQRSNKKKQNLPISYYGSELMFQIAKKLLFILYLKPLTGVWNWEYRRWYNICTTKCLRRW